MGNKNVYIDDRFAVKEIEVNYCPLPYKNITLEVYDDIFANTSHGVMTNAVANYGVKKVIINPPATIVLWEDGTKTVCKCAEGDTFDAEKGIAMCFMKKMFGNPSQVRKFMKKWIPWMVISKVKQKDVMNNRKAYNGNSTNVRGKKCCE